MRVLPLFAVLPLLATGLGSIPAASASSVKFVMAETHVELGETVEFTITNHRDETIWFNGYPFWGCWDVATGQGGPCVGLPTLYPLGAGESETHTWEQIDCLTMQPVPAGLYRVKATWSSVSEPLFQDTEAFFCIGGAPGCDAVTSVDGLVESSNWGQVKVRYRD